MAILWCGGEDIDFPNGSALLSNTTACRPGYARTGVSASGPAWSLPFVGGGITSGWVSNYSSYNSSGVTSLLAFGLVSSASGNGSGIWLGNGSAAGSVALFKYDGTTTTQLASNGVAYWTVNTVVVNKFDMQIINYGASSTVNVYVNGALAFNFVGSTAITGVSSLDCVGIRWGTAGNTRGMSEFIVADEDTRSMSVVTMAPSAAGTTDNWAGLFSAVNPIVINDANSVTTNTVALDEQFNLIDLPTGVFSIPMVKVTARASTSTGATATKIALGVNSGGTVAVGSNITLTTSFADQEQFFANNPVTSAAWTQAQMNPLQVNMRSA